MKKAFRRPGAVLGIFASSIIAVIGLRACWLAAGRNVPVTDDDKALIVRAIDLLPYFADYSPDEEFELFEKVQYVDQSEELRYEYSSPKEGEPNISVAVSRARDISEADAEYSSAWSSFHFGFKARDALAFKENDAELDLKEDNSFYSCGDRSRFADITRDGKSVGHLFVAQQGKVVYAFTLSGFTMPEPIIWHQLFDGRFAILK